MKTATYNALLTLAEGGIKSLPITDDDLEALIADAGFQLFSFSLSDKKDIARLKSIGAFELAKHKDGFTYRSLNFQAVFYRDDLSATAKRVVLSHELGHIKNKHFSKMHIMGYTDDGYVDQEQEQEANMFKTTLLTPACVLKAANVKKVKDIKIVPWSVI